MRLSTHTPLKEEYKITWGSPTLQLSTSSVCIDRFCNRTSHQDHSPFLHTGAGRCLLTRCSQTPPWASEKPLLIVIYVKEQYRPLSREKHLRASSASLGSTSWRHPDPSRSSRPSFHSVPSICFLNEPHGFTTLSFAVQLQHLPVNICTVCAQWCKLHQPWNPVNLILPLALHA